MTGPLSNSLVTGKEIELEKVSLTVMSNLVNTLAADEIHPVLNRDNLRIPIQIQLSEKQKKFSIVFAAFLKSRLNFEDFEKKDDPHSFCISETTDSESVVR